MRAALTIGGVVIIGLISIISGWGKTSAGSVAVGDCFEDPGRGGFEQVVDQDCEGPHDVQVYARAFRGATASSLAQIGNDQAADPCTEKMFDLIVSDHFLENTDIVIPDDIQVGAIAESLTGAGEVLCFIESPSGGLVGSLLP